MDTPVNTRINKSRWLNSQIGFFCGGEKGKEGYIYYTNSAGLVWTKVHTSTTGSLYDLFFINDSTGFCCGENMLLLKTTNGGQTWQAVSRYGNLDNFYNGTLYGFYGNANLLLVVGGNNFNVGIINYIFNGEIEIGFKGIPNELRCGTVFNNNTYISLGYGTAQKTSDTCKTFSPVVLQNEFFTGSCTIDSATSYACGYNGGIYKLTELGNRCEKIVDHNRFYKKRINWNGICFKDGQQGIVVGNDGRIVITKNTKQFTPLELNSKLDFLSVTSNHKDAYIISTSNGKLIRIAY